MTTATTFTPVQGRSVSLYRTVELATQKAVSWRNLSFETVYLFVFFWFIITAPIRPSMVTYILVDCRLIVGYR